MEYKKPAINNAGISACMLTPYKVRVLTPCIGAALLAV